jgi:hypothetical protein
VCHTSVLDWPCSRSEAARARRSCSSPHDLFRAMPPPRPAVRPLGTFRKRFNSRLLVTFCAGRVWTSAADKVLRRYVSVRIVAIGRPLCETPDAFPWSDGTVGATRCEGTEVLSEIRGAWSDLVQVYKPGACGLRCVAPRPHVATLHAHPHANAHTRTHACRHNGTSMGTPTCAVRTRETLPLFLCSGERRGGCDDCAT